jgi:ATP-dependent DNA helicase RecG
MLSLLNRIGNESLKSFSTGDFLVINKLFHEEKLSANLRVYTKKLINMGIIEHSGRNKYVLARSIYKVTGKPGVHTRLVGLDREANKGLIIQHLKKNGSEGAPLKELQQVLPSHSRRQIQVLLNELKNEAKIYFEGNTSAAKWFILP